MTNTNNRENHSISTRVFHLNKVLNTMTKAQAPVTNVR